MSATLSRCQCVNIQSGSLETTRDLTKKLIHSSWPEARNQSEPRWNNVNLCGEFIGHQWIPRTKASDAELWCFFDLRLNIYIYIIIPTFCALLDFGTRRCCQCRLGSLHHHWDCHQTIISVLVKLPEEYWLINYMKALTTEDLTKTRHTNTQQCICFVGHTVKIQCRQETGFQCTKQYQRLTPLSHIKPSIWRLRYS